MLWPQRKLNTHTDKTPEKKYGIVTKSINLKTTAKGTKVATKPERAALRQTFCRTIEIKLN